MKMRERWREWSLAIALYLPVALLYIAHFCAGLWNPDLVGTGFVQYDQPYYMANARQYLDGATNGIAYGLPYSALEHPPAIYFQPQIALLGLVWKLTGLDPGILFVLFGVVFGLLCIRTVLRVLDHVLPSETTGRTLLAVLFVWGGGILFLVGLAYGLLQGEGVLRSLGSSYRFDPAGGWWFLNLGRNLVYPLEAYYHFLFFSCVLFLLKKRYALAAGSAVLLAASHPFTGVATLLMLLAWSILERAFVRSKEVPRWFVPSMAIALLVAVFYYGPLLGMDPEHAVLAQQWKIAWTEDAITFVPAYVLVGLLALGRTRTPERTLSFLRSPFHRLLVIWVLTWFALENHEFAVTPVQPLHFTRGYTWSALFLIGAPFLANGLRWLHDRMGRAPAFLVIGSFAVLFTLDNGIWMVVQTRANLRNEGAGIQFTRDQRDLFQWLSTGVPANSLLVANDPMTAYLALVYTPHRAYYSHHYNTPHTEQRYLAAFEYFNGRIADPLLEQELLAVVYEANGKFVFADRGTRLYTSGSYSVYRMPALH